MRTIAIASFRYSLHFGTVYKLIATHELENLIFLELQKKQLNLRAVKTTMPTFHSEDKLIGGQMMNYEANLFQDYESIAIDELRDQANSLLKLVTEDRRPLHVFMNYDKEFLLFLRTG